VLLVNDPELVGRAEILREKGTDRSRFLRGEVDRYTWVDHGSAYAISELNAAFLWAQLQRAEELTARRLEIWDRYHRAFEPLEGESLAARPTVPPECGHNAHLYSLLLPDRAGREELIAFLGARGIGAVFHYVPLHSSPAGARLGRPHGELPVTERVAAGLVRLPLWPDLGKGQERVIEAVAQFFGVPLEG
jgi:dTDP-4-amino-4,6-dideoxygalactose transaminase